MTELEAFELIARQIHLDGVSSIQDGNPCSDTVSVLFYIENYLNHQGRQIRQKQPQTVYLDEHNQECIEFNGGYGYEN